MLHVRALMRSRGTSVVLSTAVVSEIIACSRSYSVGFNA